MSELPDSLIDALRNHEVIPFGRLWSHRRSLRRSDLRQATTPAAVRSAGLPGAIHTVDSFKISRLPSVSGRRQMHRVSDTVQCLVLLDETFESAIVIFIGSTQLC